MRYDNYKVSVVIPIYNTEDYLREAIESIINQTLGFEHIQLILVNDGSTDSSGHICKTYKTKYPENIVYIEKENGGVSSACNMGIEHATGTLVNFFGSDDKWDLCTFENVFRLYTEHREKIDVVSCRMEYFGLRTGEHPLNYKYDKDAVVDLNMHPEYAQCSDGNCFFSREAIEEVRFDERLHNAEDALFLNTVLLNKCACGVVRNAKYFYRRRPGSSASRNSKRNRFVVEPKLFAQRLFDISRERYGVVQPFIAYAIMYEMQWRLLEQPTDDITQEEIADYESILKSLLREINDEYIFDQKSLRTARRVLAFRLKYSEDLYRKIVWQDGRIYLNNKVLFSLKARKRIVVQIMEFRGEELRLVCSTDIDLMGLPYSIYMKDNQGNTYYPRIQYSPSMDLKAFNGQVICAGKSLTFQVPGKVGAKYSYYVEFDNQETVKLRPSFGWFGKLNHRVQDSYWVRNGRLVRFESNSIIVQKSSKRKRLKAEVKYLKQLVSYPMDSASNTTREGKYSILGLRVLADILTVVSNKRIWLMCDRDEHAADNASVLFEYITTHVHDGAVKPYFILSKKSVDYGRIKQFGHVVEPGSLKHHLLFLLADMLISSHGDAAITRPLQGQAHFVTDMINFKYVYLQHGIMQGDLSNWLNVLRKNIRLLPVSTKMEKEAILNSGYGYTEEEVKMLGMPRFDCFGGYEKKRIIAFMPTWRADLAGIIIPNTREHAYVANFCETDYCRFYNELINNEELLAQMRLLGYRGYFYLHPCFAKQYDDFVGNEIISVYHGTADYNKVLAEASLMVTDYSGVQFDFAYQRKPIVYSQFDDLYEHGARHSYAGTFFDYRKQGFGPIAKTVKETVDSIVALMRNDCLLDDIYRSRADEFFFYNDSNNSLRVLEALKSIE